jgi:hypothetical protein
MADYCLFGVVLPTNANQLTLAPRVHQMNDGTT